MAKSSLPFKQVCSCRTKWQKLVWRIKNRAEVISTIVCKRNPKRTKNGDTNVAIQIYEFFFVYMRLADFDKLSLFANFMFYWKEHSLCFDR